MIDLISRRDFKAIPALGCFSKDKGHKVVPLSNTCDTAEIQGSLIKGGLYPSKMFTPLLISHLCSSAGEIYGTPLSIYCAEIQERSKSWLVFMRAPPGPCARSIYMLIATALLAGARYINTWTWRSALTWVEALEMDILG